MNNHYNNCIANYALGVGIVVLVLATLFSMASVVSADDYSDGYVYYDTYTPDYNYSYYDTYTPDYSYSYYDTYTPDYDYTYYDTYTLDYDYTYYDTYTPDYGYMYYDTYTPDYYDYGCGSLCYDYVDYYVDDYSYSSGCSWCGGFGGYNYSTPHYPTYIPQVSVGQPARSSSAPSYYSNTNTNTNVNNITNIDNSINDSFNNYNSNNTSLVVATPQYPVVYTSPAPSCTINHALTGGYGYYNAGNVAYLSWTSQNATSAFLSNVGTVGVSGSQNVYPSYTTTYTLTVYGANGQTANCATTVNVNTYLPPVHTPPTYVPPTYVPPIVQQPYVALTQIPYTGFDFGPLGNSIYWLSLMGFAIAGAYLMVYYRGGAFALATTMIPTRKLLTPVIAPKAPFLIEKEAAEAARVAPVVAAIRKAGTSDTMAIIKSTDGSMPKIVIERN
ncbi:MAG: hypothetical protein AAB605_01920 [Patescibacteria group bacterium]